MSYAFGIHLDLAGEQFSKTYDEFNDFIFDDNDAIFSGGGNGETICGDITGSEDYDAIFEIRQKVIDWCSAQKMIIREVSEIFVNNTDNHDCKICHFTLKTFKRYKIETSVGDIHLEAAIENDVCNMSEIRFF